MADYNLPSEHRYSSDDEWASLTTEGQYLIGISDYAQQQLGDIVFVELPSPGDTVTAGRPLGVIESVKAVSDIVSPLSGEIISINEDLADNPEKINEDCYSSGWLICIEPSEPAEFNELMSGDEYLTHIEERED